MKFRDYKFPYKDMREKKHYISNFWEEPLLRLIYSIQIVLINVLKFSSYAFKKAFKKITNRNSFIQIK